MPVFFTQKSPVIGIWKITESWQDMLESLQDNDYYSCYVDKILSDKRKREWLAVRLLLKKLTATEEYIDYRHNGTPILRNSTDGISISHTTGFAALILSKNKNPGIDIEYHSGRAWRLREKYLGVKELEMFASIPNSKSAAEKHTGNLYNNDIIISEYSKLSTVCWCAKETAYKALQQSEVDFIEQLHIMPFVLSDNGAFTLKETKTPLQQTFDIYYQITEDYVLTWKE